MDYRIANRINYILDKDKMSSPQEVCKVIQDEIKPIIENYISLQNDIKVRFKKENNKNIFFVEIEAERIKPFGYIPYWFFIF